ncbi:hypothetical protein ACO0LF_09215 [Undibacterium sp. Di27W]|uniref:hypothetical protein n=1 Tax=Undibacterium sp. Di27W TaxID=3413036 RepID=UPI003BF12EE2
MALNTVGFYNPSYVFADLSTFGGDYSYVSAINNSGQMIGSDTKNEGAGARHSITQTTYAVIWDNSYYVPKTTLLSDVNSHAYGINDQAIVVGSSVMDVDGHSQIIATTWKNGEAHYLASLSNGQYKSIAKAINEQGVIVGESFTGDTWQDHHASMWTDTGVIDLGTLGGKDSEALAINNSGVVVGRASGAAAEDYIHPVMWKDGKIINLSPAHHGTASSINDNGVIAGSIFDDEMDAHPTLWINQKEIAMQSSAGSYCYASAINNKNQVVGSEIAANGQFNALLWNTLDSAPIDLNQYLDQSQRDAGWRLTNATDINEQGWIVGMARNINTYDSHAFLLTAQGITGLQGAAPVQATVVAAATEVQHEASADIWSGMY